MKSKITLFILLLSLHFVVPGSLFAQTDTEFWFAAPEVSNGSGSNFDRPIFLRITAMDQNSNVTIAQPANGGFNTISIPVSMHTTFSYELTNFINFIETKPANAILNTGLLITSDFPIQVYYEVSSQYNPEIFVLKGRNALGINFFTPFQNNFSNGDNYSPPASSSFDIVATEDGTEVTITPKNIIVGHLANASFPVLLNRGQTYSATAFSNLAADHLGGSTVTSNRPIAITMKDDLLPVDLLFPSYCLDLIGDQLIPVNRLGNDFIVMKGQLSTEFVYVLTTKSNTLISIPSQSNNNIFIGTGQPGQTYVVNVSDPSTFIHTSQPCYVLHMSGFGCEGGGAIIPNLNCTGSSEVGFIRSSEEDLFVNLLVEGSTADIAAFRFNNALLSGLTTPPVFTLVPFSTTWYSAQFPISLIDLPLNSTGIISNPMARFQMGLIQVGFFGGGASYGYFSGYSIQVFAGVIANVCFGDDILLTSTLFPGAVYSWSGPDNFQSADQNPTISNATPVKSGVYTVTVTTADGCVGTASVNVTVIPC